MTRSRRAQAAACAATIALGLAIRGVAGDPPGELAKDAGDALYAVMAFFGVGLLAPRLRTAAGAALAYAWCAAIECLQLYQPPWLEAVRDTLPGRLVLGRAFHPFDLACYAIGVAAAAGLEVGIARLARLASPPTEA